ncbi:Gfo/Idh/MocA family protein [Streptomyces sp. NPDC017638]|uniref:Gfo/Idh/MocA family protein n=1 Tax=Streptomyces sp. NPDC017638 TaxID=3365004 RepID=UPI00379978C7
MTFSLGIVGAGQFSGQFAALFHAHPGVRDVYVTDALPERAEHLVAARGLAGTFPSYSAMLESPLVDAVAVFTRRWTHGPLVMQGLNAGKHVYSAVPMAVTAEEVAAIVATVRATGLTYMLGETSHYHPATVHARARIAEGAFGRLFYAEGDYVHDLDPDFYDAHRDGGGEDGRATAGHPPLLYPTHSVGGVLGAWRTHAVSVSAIGVRADRDDRVLDRYAGMFDDDMSNVTALFEAAGGGSFRTNEFRRVGYPAHLRASRFRFFGTEASMEQLATVALWQDRGGVEDITELLEPKRSPAPDDPSLAALAPEPRAAFTSGSAPVHDRSRLPREFDRLANGHEGSHHFLVDDFVTAVTRRALPPVNAWVAARYTLPGIVAHESARQGGTRLDIPDFGDAPV